MIITQEKNSSNELIIKLKEKFPSLTKADLHITNNNESDMLTLVAYKLRKSKEEMFKIVKDL